MAELGFVSGLQVGDPAQLTAVAPAGDSTQVAVSLANGFPLWYEDEAGQKLQLCLDTALTVAAGVVVNPCEYGPPQVNAPPSFPGNFGSEALYWAAATFGTFTSSDASLNSALLVLAQEAGFAAEGPIGDGNQAVFGRIRIRIDVPVAGTYRVTHPAGTFDYVVDTPGTRAINQTQDRGILTAGNFLLSMIDGPAPVAPVPFIPSINAEIVNADGATIGPFLVPANPHGGVFSANTPATFAGGLITVGDASYIGLPFAPNAANPLLPLDVFQPVTAGLGGVDYFEVELLNPPDGFQLNPANLADPQAVRFVDFQLIGKLFNDGPNLPPTAVADVAGTAMNRSMLIDVAANDTDPVSGTNVHDLNPQALALADPLTGAPFLNPTTGMPQLTATQTTSAGGTVRRVTNIPTGRTSFLYAPPAGFTGTDSFEYLVQDHGGLISAPAVVTVTVEDLAVGRADFRARTGKWQVTGTSTDSESNTVTLFAGPRASLGGAAEVPPVLTDAAGTLSLRVRNNAIDYLLKVDPLPASEVTEVLIHVGSPGENGSGIFFLFFDLFDGNFTGSVSGTLTAFDLLESPAEGISTIADAVAAIREGRVYVNLYTAANVDGEIRGQIVRPVIGTVPVTGGNWQYTGRALVVPGMLPSLGSRSANGVEMDDSAVRLR